MKAFYILLLSIILSFCYILSNSASTENIALSPLLANTKTYALIKEGAILTNELFNPITTLPASYFVEINAETDDYYEVTYNFLSGFVLKTAVEIVDYEPVTKFALVYFTADNDTHPVLVRILPSASSDTVTSIPDGSKAYYFGSISGQILLSAVGSTWYCVKYDNKIGYVYCAQGLADNIPQNKIEKVAAPVEGNTEPNKNSFDWIFILALCIPAIIIMFTLFSRNKKTE